MAMWLRLRLLSWEYWVYEFLRRPWSLLSSEQSSYSWSYVMASIKLLVFNSVENLLILSSHSKINLKWLSLISLSIQKFGNFGYLLTILYIHQNYPVFFIRLCNNQFAFIRQIFRYIYFRFFLFVNNENNF